MDGERWTCGRTTHWKRNAVRSKRDLEGLVTMDHRDSPGLPDSIGVPNGMPVGSGKAFFETPTYTCSHCNAVVVMNPLRTRERGYCMSCDRYICDSCGVAKSQGVVCLPYTEFIEELLEQNEKALQRSIILP